MTVNTTQIYQIYTSSKSLYIPYLRARADSNPYSAPVYWYTEKRPNQFSHSRVQLVWVSSGFPIPLINGSGSKFEDNSTELFNRVTVK